MRKVTKESSRFVEPIGNRTLSIETGEMKMRWTVNVMLVVLIAGITQIAFGGQCIYSCKNGIEWGKIKKPNVIGAPAMYECLYFSTPVGYLVYNDDSSHNSWRNKVTLKRQRYLDTACDPGCDEPAYPVDARGTLPSVSTPDEDQDSWECWSNSLTP